MCLVGLLALVLYAHIESPAIFFTGPAFTAIFARVTLGEPLTSLDVAAGVACLCGVALVSRPGFIFHDGHSADSLAGPLAALGGAVMSAIAYCLVRHIGRRAHFTVHVTYFSLMSTILSSVALFAGGNVVPVPQWTIAQAATLLAVGVSAFIAQCFLNAGLQLANAGPATLMRNLDIGEALAADCTYRAPVQPHMTYPLASHVVFAFIFGQVFFNETPKLTSIIGASIILASTAAVALYKWWSQRSI